MSAAPLSTPPLAPTPSLLRAFATVGGYTMLSRVTGFVREILTATFLGAGAVSDAFFIAFQLPNLFRSLFAEGAFSAGFVPIFAQRLEKDGQAQAKQFADEAFAMLTSVLTVFTVLMILIMPWVLYVMAPGFDKVAGQMERTTELARIAFPYLLFVSLTMLQSGVLNAMHYYAVAAAAPVLLNIVLIASLLIGVGAGGDRGVFLAWGVFAAGVVQFLWLAAECRRIGKYTSGTTGKPKGCQHGTGGYLAYAAGTSKYYQDIHPEDVYWCMADIGWITGHSYIVYGPLTLAATTVLYEGVPNYPDAGRPWRIAEQLDVNIFHTSPTAIRMLRKAGPDEPAKYHYHFKHMTSVGEPIEPEVWQWYYDVVGKKEAAIVDTWWQTETGGFLCSTKPAIDPMKPGSAGPPALGIYPAIYDENAQEVTVGSGRAGNICIRNPWPGIMQTVWKDDDRFVRQYYQKYCRDPKSQDWRDWPYFAADAAVVTADGYFRILGRVDDVINVAGHRLGTKELESVCLTVSAVAEAAVVPVVDEIKGRVPVFYVSLKPGPADEKRIIEELISTIETVIGKIARPKAIHIVPDLPKTRSGKIMRRVLAAISNGMDTGDVTTLANPDIVEQIRLQVQGAEPIVLKDGPEDVKRFGEQE